MARDIRTTPDLCSCLALRQAARHVTQFYDHQLARADMRVTQYSILTKLRRMGPTSINALAGEMVMDRTTLGRNILPLERDGLVAIRTGQNDRRSKEVLLTPYGEEQLEAATAAWADAQSGFEAALGPERMTELRALLSIVTAIDFEKDRGGTSGRT